jgi:DNA-binding response OmpR family regulator
MTRGAALKGLRLLIVEDEALVAMMIHDVISDAGADVVGPAANIRTAMSALGAESIDGAILDVNLGGERIDPVADELRARKIPFLFVTGYGRSGIVERFPATTVVTKPFDDSHLLETIARVIVKGPGLNSDAPFTAGREASG